MQASRWADKPASEEKTEKVPIAPVSPPKEETPAAAPAPPEPLSVESSTAPAVSDTSYDYGYADPSIDPFAQTAGTDDLFFDDDIVPVSEPVLEIEAPAPEPQPAAVSPPKGGLAQSHHAARGPANGERAGRGPRVRGNRNGRGRGRGGANANANTHPHDARDARDKPEETTREPEPAAATVPGAGSPDATAPPTDPTSPPPKDQTPKPISSVRGDRTLTGGPKRARLTEEELAAKLASMRSKNEAIAAAHARAEADRADSEAREAVAAKQTAERKRAQAEKQKAERQNRQAMMGERERNRQRKLDALAGREWDHEKEEGFAGTGEERRRGAARGAYGGVAPAPRVAAGAGAEEGAEYGGGSGDLGYLSQQGYQEEYTRGGRGGRGGRGRGRGGRGGRGGARSGAEHQHHAPIKQQEQHPPTASDFPELPGAPKPTASDPAAPKKLDFPIRTKSSEVKDSETGTGTGTAERPGLTKQDSFGLPSPGVGKSWADQVEGS